MDGHGENGNWNGLFIHIAQLPQCSNRLLNRDFRRMYEQ